MIRPYFAAEDGAPAPLRAEIARRVRFEEVDPVSIVWHGRYPGFFEDARVALCDRYGVGYLEFHAHGLVAPVRTLHVDYLRPLRLREEFFVEGILHWAESARINVEFAVRNAAREVTTRGYTVQMMVDARGNVLLAPPPFYREFLDRWKGGVLA